MSDQLNPEVKISVQEQDIRGVSAELKVHQENPGKRGLSGQELIRHSIQTYTGATASAPQLKTGSDDNVLPDYAKNAPTQTKQEIEHYLSMAFKDGLVKATSEAAKSNPYVLDAFHDALAGKLYEELKKRGMVE